MNTEAKIKKYEITKSTVECYKLRHASGMYWADITVDAKDKTGRIQIASDYGDWQYYWGACGSSFKQFLTELNMEYVAGKFGEGRHFDIAATIKLNKRLVLEHRKDESISAIQARGMFTELNELGNYYDTEKEFYNDWYNKEELPKFFEEFPDTVSGVSPRFVIFWDNCWAAFIEELKKEL